MFLTLLGRCQPQIRTRQRRPRPIGPIELLEDRLAPDASFYRLAAGPFLQNWSTTPITTDNDWSTVPSIIGYNGAGLAPAPGTDPQTILADGTGTAVTVLSNQTDPTALAPAGVAEFTSLSKPTVALAADDTDQAPFLLLNLDTRETRNVRVSFNLRDLVLPASSVAEAFALQYRIGTSGDFTNLATGSVTDATNGANPGSLVTPVSVTLPGETYDQPQLQLRIITANPSGTARWIAVDDLQVTGSAAPLAFSINSASSTLSLSGDVGGTAIQQQGSGSLVTHYSGTVAAVWDHAAGTINFLSAGTDAVAAISGNWQPNVGGGSGSAPADYGGQVTILIQTARVAIRDLHASLFTTAPLGLSGSGPYSFSSTETLSVTHGFADYNAGSFGSGRQDISNNAANNTAGASGTLADLGGSHYRLTVPVDVTLMATVSGLLVHLRIQGTLVADATSPVDPALPVVALNGATGANNLAGFVQGGPAVAIAPNATVTRTPPANLTSAFVTLTNRPDGAAESLAANVGGTGLTASYDNGSGRLTISGSAPLSVYQSVLQSVTYNDTTGAGNIIVDNRLVEFTVSDGANNSSIRTAVVTIAAPRAALVNTVPPAQTTSAGTPLTFSNGGGNGISVSDPNTNPANIVQVMLSVSNGTLTLASTFNLIFVAGDNGTATFTVRGTLADINADLDGLVYTPNAGFSGTETLTMLTDDLAATDATGTAHHQTTLSTVSISVV
jgi:hypothetical protein